MKDSDIFKLTNEDVAVMTRLSLDILGTYSPSSDSVDKAIQRQESLKSELHYVEIG